MKAVMVMFDSLNRSMLPPYGCDWVHAPNFARLARRAVTFDRAYVCSMPCMPARRDLHTGRPNFLHRGWGPLEPFDDSVPEMLKAAGVHTHLVSDHYHYWEDGGATYHNRYSGWEFYRGQEGDLWKGQVADPSLPPNALGRHSRLDSYSRQDLINRAFMEREEQQPQPMTFAAGIDFLKRNASADHWMLQIETFDPHEPFFVHRKYKDLYRYDHERWFFDWPFYREVQETDEQVRHLRYTYAALVSQCDACLGDVLDAMDSLDLWKDTMLIVWTDHGFLLGEHDCWAKVWLPFYEEIAHTPFFVWDPRCGAQGERRQSLVQPSIDLGPTLLDYFGVPATATMLGRALRETVARDTPVREAALFGQHGCQVNVTDGRYVYMRAAATAENRPLYNYTLMPTMMRGFLPGQELAQAELAPPLPFTKGMPVLRVPSSGWPNVRGAMARTWLWDVEADPSQERPMEDSGVERAMIEKMIALMRQCDAPPEQYERLGLPA